MKYFAAYPSTPSDISIAIEEAEKSNHTPLDFVTWRSTFKAGRIIDKQVLQEIKNSDGLICDVTYPNENVFFEIGYAIGLMKPIIPIINQSMNKPGEYLRRLGILDNVGQVRYENSEQLLIKINNLSDTKPLFAPPNFKTSKQPVLLLKSLRSNEFNSKLTSAVKEILKFFRSFDPQEEYRMSARSAWELVNQSTGVVVTIFDNQKDDFELHNIRAAFLAGMAIALKKECLILVNENASRPLDYIDICTVIKHPDDIKEAIQNSKQKLLQPILETKTIGTKKDKNLISLISVGSNAAENEMKDLERYFVETPDFKNSLEGRGRLIVGRKGSGKTAIFWRVRDTARLRSGSELIIDLKPDGYQLRKFKEQLVALLSEGAKAHTLTAFWEYVIYCEIIYKIYENDYKKYYGRDATLTKIFDKLSPLKEVVFEAREGDFSERMIGLINEINEKFEKMHGESSQVNLKTSQVTELLYSVDLREIQEKTIEYMKTRDRTLILIDNIDKGWGAHGVDKDDVLIVSTLIEALRKIERQATRKDSHVDWLMFLRNDVFELLVDDQNDRGKEGKIIVDWNSEAALQQVIEKRIESSSLQRTNKKINWSDIAIETMDGINSLTWLVKRCLMRPRYLIQLCDLCIGHADVSRHNKIEEKDIYAGFRDYSQDILSNTNYEMRDIMPHSEDAIYSFIGNNRQSTMGEIRDCLVSDGFDENVDEIIDLMFWYAVLGICSPKGEEKYIYDYRYDKKLFHKTRNSKLEKKEIIYINIAFADGLDCIK